MLKLLSPQQAQVFVDVGANRGQSIESMRIFHPNSNIIAFEPNPHLIHDLNHKYSTAKNLKVIEMALGASSGKTKLHIPYYKNCMLDGLASILPERPRTWLDENPLLCFRAESLSIRSVEVEIRKLDDYDLNPSFIKIDVEGWEHDVVLGAEQTIRKSKPLLMIESAHPHSPVFDLLHEIGYRVLEDRQPGPQSIGDLPLNRVFAPNGGPYKSF